MLSLASKEIIFTLADDMDKDLGGEGDVCSPEVKRRRESGGYKEWNELGEKQKKRITDPILEMVQSVATNKNVAAKDLVEYVLRR